MAFDVADLLRARSWAAFHDWDFKVWLDYGSAAADFEEVVVLSAKTSPLNGSIMWRTAKAVVVQPLLGKRRRYGCVAQALAEVLSGGPAAAKATS